MALVVEALNRGLLYGSVHPFDLSVGPRMLQFCKPVLDAVLSADTIEDVFEGISIPLAIRELDAIIGEDGVDEVGDGRDEIAQELGRDHLSGFVVQFDKGKLAGPINGHEEIELALVGLDFGDIDMEEADRVALELLLRRLVALDIRQPADVVALETAVQ